MSRVVVTGIGSVGPMGPGVEALGAVLRAGEALGAAESVPTLRGRARAMRVARLAPYDAEAFIPARRLRRMAEVSRVWTTCCLLARRDAGLAGIATGPPPERRGTFLGTGFGCIDATWDYLGDMLREGAGLANPFLFSESVANAPAGHSALELDARGPSVTFTCGDASAATAAAQAARAVGDGRIDVAYCGGVDLLVAPLLRVLAAVGAPAFVGEGGVCLTLESLDSARARGARWYAEVAGSGLASDPRCPASDWSADPGPLARALSRAVEAAGASEPGRPSPVEIVLRHAPGRPAADAAELQAAGAIAPGVPTRATTPVVGTFAAAGGFNLAAAALAAAEGRGLTLLAASSWGGACAALALRPPDHPGGSRSG